jgi:DAACS family dicarboxylate/amino acid:cation (Na+ or H+) symporter
MLAGLIAGSALGALLHAGGLAEVPAVDLILDWVVRPIGRVYLRSLLALALPVVITALILGVAEIGDPRKLGRVGLVTLAYTVAMSIVAVVLGVVVVGLIRPGEGLSDTIRAELIAGAAERAAAITAAPRKSGIDLIVPDNVFAALANGETLAVMFATAVFAIGLTIVDTPGTARVREVVQGVYDVAMWLIGVVLWLAPLGVAALMLALVADVGVLVLVRLGWFVATVLIGLAIHQFVVYPLAVWALGRMHPLRYFTGIQDAMMTAFSTSASSATLPTTLRVADEMGLPSQISRFVLTVGATANQNGTALFEGVTVLFLAQFYGVHLTLGQQLLTASICVLGGIGTAGVPGGSLPVVALILGMVGVPVEGIGLVYGVDRLLDMCRTTLNVTGDLAATVVVARIERDRR